MKCYPVIKENHCITPFQIREVWQFTVIPYRPAHHACFKCLGVKARSPYQLKLHRVRFCLSHQTFIPNPVNMKITVHKIKCTYF